MIPYLSEDFGINYVRDRYPLYPESTIACIDRVIDWFPDFQSKLIPPGITRPYEMTQIMVDLFEYF